MLLTNCSPTQSPNIGRRTWLRSAAFMLLIGTVATAIVATDTRSVQADDRNAGFIEHEAKSMYSHIRIRRSGNIRTMIFVRDNGEEAYESQMNLKSPHLLRFSYLQHMFTSYLIQPEQKKVLIVGLGGGSMVHFLQKHDPQCEVDAVEIDPVVVQLAERYFALKRSKNVRLLVADAFDYFAKNETKYDVIYMDAFLKPSESTDGTGVPLRLRTLDFYKQLQSRLNDSGSVIFNINPHPDMKADLATIAEAFPQAYVFSLPNSEGVVAIGSMQPTRMKPEELRAAGREMDKRFKSGFSFETLATHVRK